MTLRMMPFRQSQRLLSAACGNADSFSVKGLTIQLNKNLPPPPDPSNMPLFGTSFSPHMLVVDWSAKNGWATPRIEPFGSFTLHPAASSLHYAIQCFEGLKAYADQQGEVRLFRVDANAKRQLTSACHVALPAFDPVEWRRCVEALVDVDRAYVPKGRGSSLYIRPTMISSDAVLGVSPPKNAKFYIICSPVGPYWASGMKPIALFADPVHRRAWPGGSGAFKVGANYGPTIPHQARAVGRKCSQVLWLSDKEELGEVGAMNLAGVFRSPNGPQVVTAPLDGTILPGVTRDSGLTLLRNRQLGPEFENFTVAERPWTMGEVVAAAKSGDLMEVFGLGTAAIVTPVDGIVWGDTRIEVPLPPPETSVAHRLMAKLLNIQHGVDAHKEWSSVVPKGVSQQYSRAA